MTCGIYLGSPKHILTDKVYIGLSVNIESRIRRHITDMRAGVHRQKMQDAYNTYGEFDWEILEECPKDLLEEREAYYIEAYKACTNGFNTYKDSNEAPILYGLDNGKVTEEFVSQCILILETTLANPELPASTIAKLTDIPVHTVKHIWYGQSSNWLKDIEPEKYIKVLNLLGSRQMGGKSAKQQGVIYPVILSPDLVQYTVDNAREFARLHGLDKGDLNNMLNMKVASVKGWIVKDLDIINPEMHKKFNSSKRGHYNRQFSLYITNRK